MKFFAIATVLIIGAVISVKALNAEQSKNAEKFTNECIKESLTTSADVENLKKGNYNKSTEKLECFAKCMLERGGFMEKGKFNNKKIMEKLKETEPKEEVEKILKACSEVKGKNECELAFNALKCYSEHKATIA